MIIKSPAFWAIVGTWWLVTTAVTLLGQGFLNPFTALGAIIFYIVAVVLLIRRKKTK